MGAHCAPQPESLAGDECLLRLILEMHGGMPTKQKVGLRAVQGCLHLMLRATSGLPSPGPATRYSLVFGGGLDVSLLNGVPGYLDKDKNTCQCWMGTGLLWSANGLWVDHGPFYFHADPSWLVGVSASAAINGWRCHHLGFPASSGTVLGMMLFSGLHVLGQRVVANVSQA